MTTQAASISVSSPPNTCGHCFKPASDACGRCNVNSRVYYCSRPCQIANWKKHKLVCGKSSEELLQARNDKLKLRICMAVERILGNIIIFSAHNACNVQVHVDMTADQFACSNLQFARFVADPSEKVADYITIKFVLSDYTETITLPTSKSCDEVIKNNPTFTSHVMYEIVY